ncbi:transglycosylase SLT domain-containing protein [Synechococcus sp. RSCCF101]|uniref:lytic transglycosylase domain-containing protein n=1 Tax=Synechococcus sp. RSCCF101 TaxID=2511069 RepID=UPI00351A946D
MPVSRRRHAVRLLLVLALALSALVLARAGREPSSAPALAGDDPPLRENSPQADPLLLPTAPGLPRTADGRHHPLVPAEPVATAALLAWVEEALRDPGTPDQQLPRLGHQQQVIYRVLSRDEPRSRRVLALLPDRWRPVAERHLAARREFLAMHRRSRPPERLPAWRIRAPEPPEQLLAHYRKAEAATGIAWEVLAAVNLVETAMGRIDGVSVANAQGPMQFLPTTWAEAGIGRGDIRDPHDAIQAAARYLVRRGGLEDIRRGLWGYNNSDRYGRAVLHYAALMEEDERAFTGLYHWEVHFASARGDLWLPVGTVHRAPVTVEAFLQRQPAGAPPELYAAFPVSAADAEGSDQSR